MIHFTCAAHGVQRVAEAIRAEFPAVDLLVANQKKIFLKAIYLKFIIILNYSTQIKLLKYVSTYLFNIFFLYYLDILQAPNRIATYKQLYLNLALPPEPLITRWGTWIQAALFNAEYLNEFSIVVKDFNKQDAVSISHVHTCLSNPELPRDLAFIATHFGTLLKIISSLEERGQPLKDSSLLVDNLFTHLLQVLAPTGEYAVQKMEAVTRRNPGWMALQNISSILSGQPGNYIF